MGMGEVGVSRGNVDNDDEDSDDINSLLSAVVVMVLSTTGLANERILLQDEDTPAARIIACSSLALVDSSSLLLSVNGRLRPVA
jgi:hypothetical protein